MCKVIAGVAQIRGAIDVEVNVVRRLSPMGVEELEEVSKEIERLVLESPEG